jgi:hypothetical protein
MSRDLDAEGIAEVERAGGYYPGLGLAESAMRERAGDYAGAVLAAYKELSWAYGYGGAGQAEAAEGLRRVAALFTEPGGDREKRAAVAAGGVLPFPRGTGRRRVRRVRIKRDFFPPFFLKGRPNSFPGTTRRRNRASGGPWR